MRKRKEKNTEDEEKERENVEEKPQSANLPAPPKALLML
jgi:hypothetical protein